MSLVGPNQSSSSSDKRKREDDGDQSDISSDSDSEFGPVPVARDESSAKRARVIGPTLPNSSADYPLPQNYQPGVVKVRPGHDKEDADEEENDSEDDDEDDDGFGPDLPPSEPQSRSNDEELPFQHHAEPVAKSSEPTKRDDWMMVPPSGGDWSSRVDPTKLKNRKFNTGKGAKGPPSSGDAGNSWHETPAEKQARLQREMMGIRDNTTKHSSTTSDGTDRSEAETAKRLAEYNKSRGPSLYNSHRSTQVEKDDDPSAREFDREKDIGGGIQINATKRKEILKSASNLGSRFSNARYL